MLPRFTQTSERIHTFWSVTAEPRSNIISLCQQCIFGRQLCQLSTITLAHLHRCVKTFAKVRNSDVLWTRTWWFVVMKFIIIFAKLIQIHLSSWTQRKSLTNIKHHIWFKLQYMTVSGWWQKQPRTADDICWGILGVKRGQVGVWSEEHIGTTSWWRWKLQ